MNPVDFERFYETMRNPESAIGEIEFEVHYPDESVYYCMGYAGRFEEPYWFGYTRPNGTEYKTVDEFVNVPEFRGQSLREVWEKIEWVSLDGVSPEDLDLC